MHLLPDVREVFSLNGCFSLFATPGSDPYAIPPQRTLAAAHQRLVRAAITYFP